MGEKFKKLITDLSDVRYYTLHNALTLLLNLAEDHKQLASFTAAWNKGDYKTAGFEIASTLLDVLEHPGIPSKNGTAALQFAFGLAGGFASDIEYQCFKDLNVEVPAIIGGIIDIASVVKMVSGFESVFHGLEGIVPCYKACLADKPRIMHLLHTVADFSHPSQLAEMMVQSVKANGIDLSLEAASAILAFKGAEWDRFGLEIGKILGKVIVGAPNAAATVVV